jgi:hypothetical protein
VVRVINSTGFVLDLMTELTLNQQKQYVQHTNLRHSCFREKADAERVRSKLYRVLTQASSKFLSSSRKRFRKLLKTIHCNLSSY